MNKNDEFIVEIEDMSVEGAGIGHFEGMTYFIKDAVVGDKIKAAVTKMKKGYGFARLVEVIESSAYRVDAKCPVAKQCGGCQVQSLSYEKQLELKHRKVRENLIRIGGFDADFVDEVMNPVVGMDEPFRYRNKAQYPIGLDRNGNIIAGFYGARSHNVVPIDDCLIGIEENKDILQLVISHMKKYNILPYDESTGRGLVRHVLVRKGFTTGEIMVCIIINGNKLPAIDELAEALSSIEGMTSISLNINKERTNRILGDKVKMVWGQPYITDYIGDVAFQISPLSFYQVNPVQTEKLYGLALEYANLTGNEVVWDLYCGIGTISLFLAQKAKQVYGVEIVPDAIEDAKRNASINNIENATFMVGKAEEVLPAAYDGYSNECFASQSVSKSGGVEFIRNIHPLNERVTIDSTSKTPDVIVVDPPRKGCDEKCLETMIQMQPNRIVYVSCDSATLCRDLKYLCANGYELKQVTPVDQFCHSMHVEVCCLLEQQKERKTSFR
ncbi:MAG: 23S rRNA (uracil(1939)-C(5))-methyltransferase RlmD [Lachnospiraceae bacterium]|nr:23S rRNA (uracil(1939)-C(5))-methyltransferase RlmD [Lachnospiraceae bacterium]